MTPDIISNIESWNWSAGVLGLGYVGLPLVVTMARAGIDVTGFDIKPSVIDNLNEGVSHIDDVGGAELTEVRERVSFTTEREELRSRDVLFICVPTPLALAKQPDVSYVEHAAKTVASILRPGHTVILESTTYPGTTEDMVRPILESTGLKLDEDFLLAYSPERIDPANQSFRTENIPRVIGGASPQSTDAAVAIYRRFVQKVHPVKNARTAEMAKLLENTFRWVNIALVNELSGIARGVGVDVWEVIDAAATKPFGFMPFYPGPGVGGHCIPLDPFFLQWAARLTGDSMRFVELAESINTRMPQVVVSLVQDVLNEDSKPLRGAKVLCIGVTFKPNIRDHRESPALDVMRFLRLAGGDVSYHDPHVPNLTMGDSELQSQSLDIETLQAADCVLILADHDAVDYDLLIQSGTPIVDTRNAIGRRSLPREKVRTL